LSEPFQVIVIVIVVVVKFVNSVWHIGETKTDKGARTPEIKMSRAPLCFEMLLIC
jgi:hypothetical protein